MQKNKWVSVDNLLSGGVIRFPDCLICLSPRAVRILEVAESPHSKKEFLRFFGGQPLTKNLIFCCCIQSLKSLSHLYYWGKPLSLLNGSENKQSMVQLLYLILLIIICIIKKNSRVINSWRRECERPKDLAKGIVRFEKADGEWTICHSSRKRRCRMTTPTGTSRASS